MSEPSGGKSIAGIVVRGVVIAFALGAVVAAAVAVGTLNDFLGSAIEGGGLATDTRGASGWIMFVGIITIIIMALFLALGIAGRETKVVHGVGIVFSILLGLGYLAGGIAAAKFAKDYDDLGSFGGLPSELERVMISLAAAAGLSLFSDILLLVLVIVSIVALVKSD